MGKTRLIQFVGSLAILSLVSCSSSGGGLDTTSSEALAAQANAQKLPFDSAILAEINRYRTSEGKEALSSHGTLSHLASKHSNTMAQTGEAGHDGFSDRAATAKSSNIFPLAENIANEPSSLTASDIVKKWSLSSTHNKNMLGPYNTCGVGSKIANGRRYVTLIVGSR